MIRLEVERAMGFEGAEEVLARAFEELARRIRDTPAIQGYAIPGKDLAVKVVLGGARECRRWSVTPKALGFHAVCSRMRHDRKTGDRYRNLNEGFEAHVNVAPHAALLAEDWPSGDFQDRHAELVSALVTLPHEVLHALEWIRETGGLTPDEVYADDGERGLDRVKAGMEARLAPAGGTGEDTVEASARSLAWAVSSLDWIEPVMDALGAEFPAAPSP